MKKLNLNEATITAGKTASAATIVMESTTAEVVGSGSLAVFATPMMAALMEQAACACLADALEPGQTSVGTKIDIAHIAASPVGAEITATATITAVSGRRIEFEVVAHEGEKQIGGGKHTRVIVDEMQFMNKLQEK